MNGDVVMEEKEAYQVYVGVLKLHKKYIGLDPNMENLSLFISDINTVNSTLNLNLCNALTEILRQWFICGFRNLEESKIAEYYTDLWKFHKKYFTPEHDDKFWEELTEESCMLSKKYKFCQCRNMILAILSDIEREFREDKKPGVAT